MKQHYNMKILQHIITLWTMIDLSIALGH